MYYVKKSKNPQSKARTGYDNLYDQILSVKNGTNVKSYATRARYFDGTERFVRYCAEEWNLQKFVNVSGKHKPLSEILTKMREYEKEAFNESGI